VKRRNPLAIWAGLVYALLYLPIIVMAVNSFNASRYSSHWGGFTFHWYRTLIDQEEVLSALWTSLWIGGVSTLIAILLGTSAALALHASPARSPAEAKYKLSYADWIEAILMCPVILPDIVIGIALLMLFVFLRIQLAGWTIVLAHVTFSMVYVLIVVRVRLKGLDPALREAALDLGATNFQAFYKVTLPLILPGVIAGGLLGFTLSFEDFVITFFTAGVGNTTLPIQIYSMTKFGVSPVVSALSTAFLVLTAAATFALQKMKVEST
jgi:spermidine/putrescine transport system permease protein